MKLLLRILMLVTVVVGSSLITEANAQTQKVSLYTYHTHVPFITAENEGLSYDLAKMLTEDSAGKYEFKVVATSRPRINKLVKKQGIGFVPWINPIWFKDREEKEYLWGSSILMMDANSILSHRSLSKDYTGPKSLENLVFGGIKGHVYSGIDEFINNGGNLRRVDSDNHADNMEKVRNGDVDVMLMPRSGALYTIAKHKLDEELYVSPSPHSSYERRFLVINHNQKLLEFIDRTLTSRETEWKKLIEKYK